jgi:hypothetical protein
MVHRKPQLNREAPLHSRKARDERHTNSKRVGTNSTRQYSYAALEICNSFSLMVDLTQAFSAKDRLRPDNVGTVSTGTGRGSVQVCVVIIRAGGSSGCPPAKRRTFITRELRRLEAVANYLSQQHYIKRRTDTQMGAETCCALIISSNLCLAGYPEKRMATAITESPHTAVQGWPNPMCDLDCHIRRQVDPSNAL